jgi:hypothetical protein
VVSVLALGTSACPKNARDLTYIMFVLYFAYLEKYKDMTKIAFSN